ncbi:GNAT family N-acetyltransferase [Paenibacillus sp. FSL W8-1187]|uniref:GCN5-related N-acetyltransferase n=1 Tax=Paenibacillus pasadenensis TaxID=217090 RepID=A0A2N5N6S9_9BACL|nr:MULTISPECIES: GNAT family N-acetyltransferase [Paenibacillus]PLT46057.1 GCN5-related N-acetyltransferase [Paenibacillus pasadenensis]QGG56535.1 GNAT family N-acetyltransferase [Paenibacillus sp. B01]
MRAYYEIEEAALNSWPALQTSSCGGWLVKSNRGYTKRSNSVQPLAHLAGGQELLDAKIRRCEAIYRQTGQPAIFKITPFAEPAELDAELARRGYRIADPSIVMTADIGELEPESAGADALVSGHPTAAWLRLMQEWGGCGEEALRLTEMMFEASTLPCQFALLHAEGRPVSLGLAVLDGRLLGFYDIMTAPECRGRGYGRRLLRHLLHWGREQGAEQAYLQVVSGNKAAERLYAGLGFREAYPYWYRVQQGEPVKSLLG